MEHHVLHMQGTPKNLGTPTIIKKQGLLNNSELYKNMNEGFSAKAKATSKNRHEFRKISKFMDRRQAAVDAGDDDTALRYSNKLHNYAIEGGNRNPKIARLANQQTTSENMKWTDELLKLLFERSADQMDANPVERFRRQHNEPEASKRAFRQFRMSVKTKARKTARDVYPQTGKIPESNNNWEDRLLGLLSEAGIQRAQRVVGSLRRARSRAYAAGEPYNDADRQRRQDMDLAQARLRQAQRDRDDRIRAGDLPEPARTQMLDRLRSFDRSGQ